MRRMTFNAAELDKFRVINGDFDFVSEVIEQASKHEPWSEIVKSIERNGPYKPVLIFDSISNYFYFGTQENHKLYVQTLYDKQGYALEIKYDNITDKLTITITEENYITYDDPPKMYRHQMTITNQNNVSVTYIVNASNDLVINTLEKFIEVTKANADYIGLASYQDASNNVQPAFIRYSFGNVVIQLQNGSVSPMKSISDIVTPI